MTPSRGSLGITAEKFVIVLGFGFEGGFLGGSPPPCVTAFEGFFGAGARSTSSTSAAV